MPMLLRLKRGVGSGCLRLRRHDERSKLRLCAFGAARAQQVVTPRVRFEFVEALRVAAGLGQRPQQMGKESHKPIMALG
jgi:hypothetical protein